MYLRNVADGKCLDADANGGQQQRRPGPGVGLVGWRKPDLAELGMA